ncbi:LacI family DNA-binding transcriptional regulator [Actinocatenispora rupis]|uniref:LacI family transcriptional regulator n=1 Tax=Actinocatenispora rupis TaxID=519421 RepID=A0A8J3J6C6_9ACTN|nr:LacI family DNA-binding transcriptional regulator [Actinocatenispora rupis]GID12436.1 LacI family transcriptional regulator [Actinocatenispora rupis]
MARVTIAQVAAAAGVSKASASRALNDHPDVGAATVERVRAAADRLGYVPSASAVRLARGSQRTIGMLVPSLAWPWMLEVLGGIATEAEAQGYALVLQTLLRGDQSLASFVRQVESSAIDGVVAIEPPGGLAELRDLHVRRGFPVVMIDDRVSRPDYPSVATTNERGAYEVAAHLADVGAQRIGVITGPADFTFCAERDRGWRRALAERDLTLREDLVLRTDMSEPEAYQATGELLSRCAGLDTILAVGDMVALGALRMLRDKGVRVPDDVRVAGFDDIPAAALAVPPLTTVRQPMYRMGEAAARLLVDLIGGADPPTGPRIIPTELVIRESSTR